MTMRGNGSNGGYIWAIDPSRNCAKAVCSRLSQCNVEWGFKENRVAVIALNKCGKSDSQIFELLKPLEISRKYVYRAIKPYKELWGVEDRARSGRPRCVRTKAAIETVRKRIRWNPLRKQNSFSREINLSPRSISRLIRDDLHMTA